MNFNQIFTIICQNKSRLLVKGGKGKGDFGGVVFTSCQPSFDCSSLCHKLRSGAPRYFSQEISLILVSTF